MKKTINNNHRPNCGCPSFAIINRTLVNLKLNIDCHKVQTLISSQHFNVNTNSQRVVGIYLLTMHPLLLASLVTTISAYNSYLWLWLLSWWDLIFFDEFTRQTSQVIFFCAVLKFSTSPWHHNHDGQGGQDRMESQLLPQTSRNIRMVLLTCAELW